MELTNELKARFFGLYLGETVHCDGDERVLIGVQKPWSQGETPTLLLHTIKKAVTPSGVLKTKIFDISNYDADICTLFLRPLSSITEEELYVCWELSCKYDKVVERKDYTLDPFRLCPLPIYDYLRSKGYALWFMGIPVNQWVGWGVVKLKTE